MKESGPSVSAGQDSGGDSAQSEFVRKQQILEKLRKRLGKAREMPMCSELNPDVIVIPADQSFLFEPQNPRASELLRRCCAVDAEDIQVRERVRVHPCQSRKIIDNLRTAGLHVVC